MLVEQGGEFALGSENNPMNKDATMYIKKPFNWNPFAEVTGLGYHTDFGSRFFVGNAGSIIRMHGR